MVWLRVRVQWVCHLLRPFEALLTSWLQMALHKDPQRRGTKTAGRDVAPCLAVMEQNLNTLVWNAVCFVDIITSFLPLSPSLPPSLPLSLPPSLLQMVNALCMQTGDVYSYIIKPEDT